MAQLPDSIDFALKIWAAITVPGSLIAACWKLTQARTYAARIELTVSGEILHDGDKVFLQVHPKIKNIGQGRVKLRPRTSYIEISRLETDASSQLVRTYTDTVLVFINNLSFESSESMSDLQLISLADDNCLGIYLEFGVTTQGFAGFLGRDWTTNEIIHCKLKK